MGNPARDQVLMVGDTPESDILGGINAGLDTCWLNVDNKVLPKGITPKYQVSSLVELQQLLLED
jgi:FMN phosphatase YigB (HAD superfamily)